MESSKTPGRTLRQPLSIPELMPDLGGLLSAAAKQSLTAMKKPPPRGTITHTNEKVLKPMSSAEMKPDLKALAVPSPSTRVRSGMSSARKKIWNSSVKVDKTGSLTANGQMKYNSVRKALKFSSAPSQKSIVYETPKFQKPNPRNKKSVVQINNEKPRFQKPEAKSKMSVLQARANGRISGVSYIPSTPLESTRKPVNRMTIANKENVKSSNNTRIIFLPQKPAYPRITQKVPCTPLSNESFNSSGDASFLMIEKEIHNDEKEESGARILEDINELSPPASTPFRHYRKEQQYLNNSSQIDPKSSDNTLMIVDKICTDAQDREESDIVSLCDMLTKTTMNTSKNKSLEDAEIQELVEIEKQSITKLQMIRKVVKAELQSLENVRKIIKRKRDDLNKLLDKEDRSKEETISCSQVSVIKSPISPTFRIPKKNLSLRQQSLFKSLPNISDIGTPVRHNKDKALNMYMEMKQNINFLNTPVVKQRSSVPDTPAVTSQNLQKQLDKLFNES